jgi:hypothetical protein
MYLSIARGLPSEWSCIRAKKIRFGLTKNRDSEKHTSLLRPNEKGFRVGFSG